MNILITVQNPEIKSNVDPKFGRTPWFLKVNTDTKEWEAVANSAIHHSGGAGVAAAQSAVDQRVQAVISGDFGPNAAAVLNAASIKMYKFSPDVMTGEDALNKFLQGSLEEFA
jgi:predicted Fe-Mo cluster-binding NifX family protein